MAILDDINAIAVLPRDIARVVKLRAQSPDASDDARMLNILHYVQEKGVENAAGMALAIGWRLQALDAFLTSPEGKDWNETDFEEGSGIFLECAAIEKLIERGRRPRFDHPVFADHLLQAANGR